MDLLVILIERAKPTQLTYKNQQLTAFFLQLYCTPNDGMLLLRFLAMALLASEVAYKA